MATKGRSLVKARLSQVQFFQLCEELRNNEEWFKTNKPTLIEGVKFLGEKMGHVLSQRTVRIAARATGVTWEQSPKAAGTEAKMKMKYRRELQEVRDLTDALSKDSKFIHSQLSVLIHHLYEQLGAKYPPGYIAPTDPTKVNVAAKE